MFGSARSAHGILLTVTTAVVVLAVAGCGKSNNDGARPRQVQPPAPTVVKTSGNTTANPPAVVPGKPAPTAGKPAATANWKPRTPAQIRTQGNFLKSSGSLYLRQHQNNPMEWYPWGPEALARSKAENKPIFLSIGYSSCHWCHVMEHEVFEKDPVATYMNTHFVNIKVDREERPDLDTIYMDAVVAMTGRGGWPMTVFLTPDLKPFKGGTYFPEARFMRLVQGVQHQFTTDRATIEAEGTKYAKRISAGPRLFGAGAMSVDILKAAPDRSIGAFDTQWGGFRQRTKFPTPSRWGFLMNHYRKFGDPAVGKQVDLTLEKMATGGVYDHVGGGFHRYSVDRKWMVPHFEKMLYDNGQLIELYVNAAATFGKPLYREVAVDIMEFMLRDMRDPKGAFYASYDADSGGVEGTFYVWTAAQLKAVAGERDGAALAEILDVTPQGNFEHNTTVVSRGRRDLGLISKKLGRPVKELAGVWPKWRATLREVRAKRTWPGLDKKIVTAWNGLAIAGFASGYALTGDVRFRRAAEEASEYLWKTHRRSDGSVYRVSNNGRAEHVGILDDYTFWADGLVSLFMATQDPKHLERALLLVAEVDKRFKEPNGAWFLTEVGAEAPLGRQVDPSDSVRPSGMSRMLRTLMRLASLQGDAAKFKRVDAVLTKYMGLVRGSGLGAAGWLDVGLMNAGPMYEVVIAGDRANAATQALVGVLTKRQPLWAVRAEVPAEGPDEALKKLMPPTFGKVARKGKPHAYVCVLGSCKKPTSNVAEFEKQLMDGWRF